MTTIGKYEEGCEQLSYSKNLLDLIKQIQENWKDYKDIQEEAKILWLMLHKRDRPSPPKIDSTE